jgi:ribonuclease III
MLPDLAALEAELEYQFEDRELLIRALTHKSRAYEDHPAGSAPTDNEQFEFLGDSILGFLVSEYLFRQHPAFPEGHLSKLKAHLVSAARLQKVARTLGLGGYLRLGRGEEMSGGRDKPALLADALEAVIAAIYLDGGIAPVRAFIERCVIGDFCEAESIEDQLTDYKTALQERAQALRLPQPRYSIVDESGPEHAKTFTVEARVGRSLVSQGQGLSKKSAGQKAAQRILEQLAAEQS